MSTNMFSVSVACASVCLGAVECPLKRFSVYMFMGLMCLYV